jgi:DNA-binding MarR family transcriptional regulator
MPKQRVLRPLDIPVALYLALYPERPYAELANDLQVSASTAHDAVKRLTYAGLARQSASAQRRVNVSALLEFLEHGIRYAFPAQRERPRRGVPTAHAAPILKEALDADTDPVVWPSARSRIVGSAIEPLLKGAVELPLRSPEIYDLLTLVDAIRIGTARDREVASELLRKRLEATVESLSWTKDQADSSR